MKKNAIVVAWGNQKGGAGKSTVSRLIATHLWYKCPGYKVVVWDCDNPQYTNARLREVDMKILDLLADSGRQGRLKSNYLSHVRQYPLYPIKEMNVERIERDQVRDREEYDILFIDLPGKIDSAELAKVLPIIDYLFIPLDYDYGTVDSTVRYLKVLQGFGNQFHFPFVNGIRLFFNKIKKTSLESSAIPVVNDIMQQNLGAIFMEQVVLLRDNIKDDTLSTIAPLHDNSKVDNSHFYTFFDEFCHIIDVRPEFHELPKNNTHEQDL